jgi:hypothetical protein
MELDLIIGLNFVWVFSFFKYRDGGFVGLLVIPPLFLIFIVV